MCGLQHSNYLYGLWLSNKVGAHLQATNVVTLACQTDPFLRSDPPKTILKTVRELFSYDVCDVCEYENARCVHPRNRDPIFCALFDSNNLRFEHRTSGADANPYLVTAAILAGVHYGLKNKCDPGRMVEEGEIITLKRKIPNRWDTAIDKFSRSKILPQYLGEEYCRIYAAHRRDESRRFHNIVSNVDFDWYMRAV